MADSAWTYSFGGAANVRKKKARKRKSWEDIGRLVCGDTETYSKPRLSAKNS